MGYYDKSVSRTDKSGSVRKVNDGFQEEIDDAKRSDKEFIRSDVFSEGNGYLGIDNLDRLRRYKLKHETK